MATKYDDDEKIVAVRKNAAPGLGSSENDGTVTAKVYRKPDASLKREKITVLLELTGMESNEIDERPGLGLDIVLVLDVSRSMKGKKLQNLKKACTFLIKKLSPIDRVSVIKFSETAEKLCPLTLMTSDGKSNIEHVIRGLTTGDGTNMTAGLNEAVKVLKYRTCTDGRLTAIMFMTDGDSTSNAKDVDCGDIPVHTFGLGHEYDPTLLAYIARKSVGGTFNASDADNPAASSLCRAFAICLGGLLSMVATDLKVVITSVDRSTVDNVSAGDYPQENVGGSVTISLGNLYAGEIRNVLVDVVLDEVDGPEDSEVLNISCSYKKVGMDYVYDIPSNKVNVSRREQPSTTEIIEVQEEVARKNTSQKIKKALDLADEKVFGNANLILEEAVNDLEKMCENSSTDELSPLVSKLIEEVKQFKSLMETEKKYLRSGRAFGYASELSHALQRASAGGNASQTRLYETPAMKQAAAQANEYEINPAYIVPTSEDDILTRISEQKEKVANNRKRMKYMNERIANQKVAKKSERENEVIPGEEKTFMEMIRNGLDAIRKCFASGLQL